MSLVLAAATSFAIPHIDYTGLLPELVMLGGALVVIAAGALSVRHLPTSVYSLISGATGLGSLATGLFLWFKIHRPGRPLTIVAHSLAVDGFSTAFVILASAVVVVSSLVADGYLKRERLPGPEFHALALLAASGAMFMAAANDLIIVFLGLEIMSIPLYILAAMDQRRAESGEAGMKYFVLGAFSSAIFVYGVALTYGATGSTNLAQIAAYLAHNVVTNQGLLLAGAGLLLVGFLFKVAAVPFHMWTPDVYQGAPSPATGYMAAIAKVGGFAALLRVFYSSFHSLESSWKPIIWIVALLTLLLGAVMGLVQRDVKRLLAYSSINHAGFVLLGLQAASAGGLSASLYYVFIYSFLVLGSFAVIAVVAQRGDRGHAIESYRGLFRRQPALALAFAVLLLAQAGAPFTTGFLGKLYVVEAAVRAHSYALAIVAMLTGAVAAAYYLRVVFVLYSSAPGAAPVDEPPLPAERVPASGSEIETAPTAGAALPTAFSGAQLSAATATLLAPAPQEELPAPTERGRSFAALGVAPSSLAGIAVTVLFTVALGIWPGPLFSFVHAASVLF